MDPYIAPQASYQYAPLLNDKQIRILVLRPHKSLGDALHADIESASMSESAEYMTISYSWGMNENGDDSLSQNIIIDGFRLPITQNIFECLQRLSFTASAPLRIWVDAICINQSDRIERSSQVAVMAQIYQNARKTIIWLGKDDAECDGKEVRQLFERVYGDQQCGFEGKEWMSSLLHTLMAAGVGLCSGSREGERCSCGQPFIHLSDPEPIVPPDSDDNPPSTESAKDLFAQTMAQNEALFETVSRRLKALIHFLNRRYWRRRWVLQEIWYSKTIHICWTELELTWEKFKMPLVYLLHLCIRLCNIRNLREDMEGIVLKVMAAGEGVHSCFLNQGSHLKETPEETCASLLYYSHSLDCSDPRDRLFSLLSVADLSWIMPNYELSPAEVYSAFARGLIERNHGGEILHLLSNRGGPRDEISSSLPSWLPDLRCHLDKTKSCEGLSHLYGLRSDSEDYLFQSWDSSRR